VTQVLNQGLAAPIDVQITGRQTDSNYALTRLLASEIRQVPGAADVRISQVMDEPEIFFTVNRDRAQQMDSRSRASPNPCWCRSAEAFRTRPISGSTRRTALTTPSTCRRRSTACGRSMTWHRRRHDERRWRPSVRCA